MPWGMHHPQKTKQSLVKINWKPGRYSLIFLIECVRGHHAFYFAIPVLPFLSCVYILSLFRAFKVIWTNPGEKDQHESAVIHRTCIASSSEQECEAPVITAHDTSINAHCVQPPVIKGNRGTQRSHNHPTYHSKGTKFEFQLMNWRQALKLSLQAKQMLIMGYSAIL